MDAFSCWDICPAWPTQSPRRRRADGAKSSAMKHKMIAACANRHCRDEGHSLNIERSAATTTTRRHRNYNIIFGTEYKCTPLVNGVLSHCSLGPPHTSFIGLFCGGHTGRGPQAACALSDTRSERSHTDSSAGNRPVACGLGRISVCRGAQVGKGAAPSPSFCFFNPLRFALVVGYIELFNLLRRFAFGASY